MVCDARHYLNIWGCILHIFVTHICVCCTHILYILEVCCAHIFGVFWTYLRVCVVQHTWVCVAHIWVCVARIFVLRTYLVHIGCVLRNIFRGVLHTFLGVCCVHIWVCVAQTKSLGWGPSPRKWFAMKKPLANLVYLQQYGDISSKNLSDRHG